jgi:hypothetical protein
MSCCDKKKKIHFTFSINDPEFTSKTNVVDSSDTNYISHVFVKCPIYNKKNIKIGYKVSDDYVQQVAKDRYIVRLNNTYVFSSNDKTYGSISWQYVFENNTNTVYYPVNIPAISNIISGTGKYLNCKGDVKLVPKSSGERKVSIYLD